MDGGKSLFDGVNSGEEKGERRWGSKLAWIDDSDGGEGEGGGSSDYLRVWVQLDLSKRERKKLDRQFSLGCSRSRQASLHEQSVMI